MTNKFYITTAIAYTNGAPHIGHALEFIQADVLARYHRMIGDEVYFLTGTDEHGSNVAKAADKAGQKEQDFVDRIAMQFMELDRQLNISNDGFIRTSDKVNHWPAVDKIWRKIVAKGDLYKKSYEGLYCSAHEAFVKKSDLVDGLCSLHKTEPAKVKEENWFFKLTKYKKDIKKVIESDELKIVPESRKNEILNLLDDAEDISFSRPSSTLKWGIPVPDDVSQTIYVWADALTNYISAIGYFAETEQFKKLWPADVHLIGKDILRFHALYWPAMLMSADLPLPRNIYIHGFINVDGEKMSKTLGNGIDPFMAVEKYGSEVIRYFLLREIPSGEDGDFSYKKLEDRYNGDLANNLGNLVSRVAKLIETKLEGELNFDNKFFDKDVAAKIKTTAGEYRRAIDEFKLHEALTHIFNLFTFANAYIDEKKPWADVAEHPEHFLETLTSLVGLIISGTKLLEPFLPETAQKIFEIFEFNPKIKELNGYKFKVNDTKPLFPRLK